MTGRGFDVTGLKSSSSSSSSPKKAGFFYCYATGAVDLNPEGGGKMSYLGAPPSCGRAGGVF
jgi:hypothetical protein